MARAAAIFFACCTLTSSEDLSLLQTSTRVQRQPQKQDFVGASSGDLDSVVGLFGDGTHLDEHSAIAAMAAAPLHPATQVSGCRSLGYVIQNNLDEAMTPSVIEPIVQAIKNNVDEREVVTTCFRALAGFNVTFNRTRTLAINNGTHIAEAVAATLRHYPHDRAMMKDALIWVAEFSTFVACEVQPPFVDAGCIDMVWDALDYFTGPENSDVQMSAWIGFSEHSCCKYSANAIMNHGGKNRGAEPMVQAMREASGNRFHPDEQHGGYPVNLQYEILTVANGLLRHADDAADVFDAFVRAGFVPAVLSSMRDQPDQRSTNERVCEALWILSHNTTIRPSLVADGALELIAGAMERFKGKDHGIYVNMELGDFYPVLPPCDLALQNLATNSTAAQDALLQLGVLKTYETMRQDLPQLYPWMNNLPPLLRARAAARSGDRSRWS